MAEMEQSSKQLVQCLVCGEVFDAALGQCPVCGVGLEQCKPVQLSAPEGGSDTAEKFLILGGGTAAFNAAKAIRERNATCSIVILTSEDALPYNRPMLTKTLLSGASPEDIAIEPASWYDERDIYVVTGCTVTAIDPAEKLVACQGGMGFAYDKLIYALGARCFLPPIPGSDQPHVVTIRTVDDARRVRSFIGAGEDAVVIGGGVLGLEAAWALRQGKVNVTILEQGPQIMARQIDADAAALLTEAIAAQGVTLLHNAKTERIGADQVTLADGSVLPAKLVIVSAGIRANTAVAEAAGLAVSRNIVVDEHMRTSAPDVYACGDCAVYGGLSYGLWSEASEMGRIAGVNASGGDEAYAPVSRPLIFHGMGTALFALGDCGKKGLDYQVRELRRDGRYEKYYLAAGRLTGAILLGDISPMGRVMAAVLEGGTVEQVL